MTTMTQATTGSSRQISTDRDDVDDGVDVARPNDSSNNNKRLPTAPPPRARARWVYAPPRAIERRPAVAGLLLLLAHHQSHT